MDDRNLSGEQCLEFLLELGFSSRSNHFIDQFTLLEEEDGGYVSHPELYGDVVVLFDVTLAHDDFPIVLLSKL